MNDSELNIVYPLAMTHVDWEAYIGICKEVLGYSPTRGLDDAHIDIKSPAAFFATLSLDNKPLVNLREARENNNTLDHVTMSFIIITDALVLIELASNSKLILIHKTMGKKNLAIVTGTMSIWQDAVVCFCSMTKSKDLRIIGNRCLQFFNKSGFRDLWFNYTKLLHPDKTFTLMER